MAKEASKPVLITRTEDLQREIAARRGVVWSRFLRSRNFVLGIVIWTLFTLLVGSMAVWVRSRPLLAPGRLADHTRTVRAPFTVVDSLATEQARAAARQTASRVYIQAAGVIEEIVGSIRGFPRAIESATSINDIDPGLRERFRLNDQQTLDNIKAALAAPGARDAWDRATDNLRERLLQVALVDDQTFQVEATAINKDIELRDAEGNITGRARDVRSIESPDLAELMAEFATLAGFYNTPGELVRNRLTSNPRPTYIFDEAATTAAQQAAANAVAPIEVPYPNRSVIIRRGDPVTPSQIETYREALRVEREKAPKWTIWVDYLGTFGVVGIVALALAGYTAIFAERVRRDPARMAWIAAVLAVGALIAWWGSTTQPALIMLTATAPTLFVSTLLAIAYDRRSALAWGALHGVLVCIGLQSPGGGPAGVGLFATIMCGVGFAIWSLREVRERDSLIKMGLLSGLGLGAATFFTQIVALPLVNDPASVGRGLFAGFEQLFREPALAQIFRDVGFAAFGGPLVAAIVLFILPSIERWFDITTGMTLVELRDPKNPLLRMLQQRAPGTYNHSLNLASLAEAAADAIGADSLLTYVGSLYHDIGKMNKPEYFVENQTPGINKHDKLSPAMSLLIIVGHVKDGMELAREFNLPRPIWHFIESHHGTTLVEYFFHRARKQAEREALIAGLSFMDQTVGPSELEYRYPGPKPRTREAAIVMLCDTVESASRAMADPTPARIDATVRAIANKRLMDGQFDDCDLTLRDLNLIVEAVSKALSAMYHGRIAYPSGTTAAGARVGPSVSSGVATLSAAGAGSSSHAGGPGGANGAKTVGLPTTKLPEGAPSPLSEPRK